MMTNWKKITAGMLGLLLTFISYAEENDLTQPAEIGFTVNEFVVVGQIPFDEQKVESLLSDFTGQHVGIEGLQAAGDALEAQLKKEGYAFIDVSLPPQTLQDGVVTLEVVQSRISKVVLKGRETLSEDNLARSMPDLRKGMPLNAHRVSRSVNMANENPLKNIKVTFGGGDKPGDIVSTVDVEEGETWNGFLGVSNTGTEQSGEFRTTIGYQYNNVFDRDHRAILAYTTNPEDPSTLSQYALSYLVPFYRSGSMLTVFASHSDINTGLVSLPDGGGDLFIEAAGTAYGLEMSKRLLNVGRVKQQFSLALNNSLYDNDSMLGGSSIGSKVRSTPVILGYIGSYSHNTTSLNWGLKYGMNLEYGSNNDEATYEDAGLETTPDWDWIRYRFGIDKAINRSWIWRFNGKGQTSGQALISGEQFGIGGSRSVRGYDERVALGDAGYQLSTELWFPSLPWQKIRVLTFFDVGEVSREAGDLDDVSLSSAGLGLRWAKPEVASVTLDVGVPFDDVNDSSDGQVKGDAKAHVNVYWRF